MSNIDCQLHFYDVTRCGIYSTSANQTVKHLPIGSLLKELKVWAVDSKKPLIETSTYNANKKFLEAFCIGIAEYKGQYLIALWNKVPHSKSGVGMVNGASTIDSVKVTHSKVGKGDIPGYPSYFWISPTAQKFACLRFENPALGVSQFKEYLKGYLTNFCSYRVRREVDGELIEGLSDFPAPKAGEDQRLPNKSYFVSFYAKVCKVPGYQKEILEKSALITKVVKDVTVYNSMSDSEAGFIERISEFFGNLSPSKKKKLRVQMPVDLLRQDVQGLIDDYNDNGHSEEFDVGFVFKNHSGHIEWLSGSNQTEKISIDVSWIGPDQPDLDKLLKTLQSQQHLIDEKKETSTDEKAG